MNQHHLHSDQSEWRVQRLPFRRIREWFCEKKKKLYEKGRDLHTLICRNFQTLNVSKRMLLFFYLFFNCFYLNQAIGRHVRFCLRSTTNLSIQAFFFHYRSYSQSYTTCALHSGNLSNCLFGGLFFLHSFWKAPCAYLTLKLNLGCCNHSCVYYKNYSV